MEWDPTQFFREDINSAPPPFALIVLNQPINEAALSILRRHALLIVCADGGANRFFECVRSRGKESTDLPDVIIGDLDSIHPDVRAHYADLGVSIVQDDDQYSTDFTKSLKYIRDHEREILPATSESQSADAQTATDNLEILILGGLGGRVDQAFSQIHHLYLMNQNQKQNTSESGSGNLYLISEESITFILQPGKNSIRVPGTNRPHAYDSEPQPKSHKEEEMEGGDYLLEENVGIIPISGPAKITTKGFEWDVEDWATEIGGQISTSNHIRAEVVHVETGTPVLFTLELAKRLKRGSQ